MLLAAALAAEPMADLGGESTETEVERLFLALEGLDVASSFLVAPNALSFSSGTYSEHQSGMMGVCK